MVYYTIKFDHKKVMKIYFQTLHSISFSFYYAAAIQFAFEMAPLGVRTTMMSLFNGIYSCGGNLFGNIVGGILFQKYGGRTFFRFSAYFYFVWTFLFTVVIIFRKQKDR